MTGEREQWDDADVAAVFMPIDGAQARCPAPELLSAARAETLPPALQARVSDHLAACVACRALAEALPRFVVEVARAKPLAERIAVLVVVQLDFDPPVLAAHGADHRRTVRQ